TATEISQVQQSSSAMIRSVARSIESRLLEPTLNMAFRVALQHFDFRDPVIVRALGEEAAAMFDARREEFARSDIGFSVRGLSSLIDRQVKLRGMLALLQTIGSNEILLREFLTRFDPAKVLSEL